MENYLFGLFCTLLLIGSIELTTHETLFKELNLNEALNDKWLEFKEVYTKTYSTVPDELKRRLVWESNLKTIDKHNERRNF